MNCHKLLNVVSLGIINWNRNYQKPLTDNVIYIYFFATHPSVLSQDLHPAVTILIFHTFLYLLRISSLFPFSFHPLPYILNPVLLILQSCPAPQLYLEATGQPEHVSFLLFQVSQVS